MGFDREERRKALALELLVRLKEIRDQIQSIMASLGDSADQFLSTCYEDHVDKIKEKVSLYNRNIERIEALNLSHTALITDWFLFIKNEKVLSSPLFPFHLFFKKRKIKAEIRGIKEEISNLVIKNRLIREDIQRLESGLEVEADLKLKKDGRYEDYLAHLTLKSQLIREIEYLFPTLSGVDMAQIHMDGLEEAIEVLR